MPSTIELIRDAVTYRRINYPLDLNEVLAYLTTQNFVKNNGQPFSLGDVHSRLQNAVTNGKAILVHDMFWFPDIPVSDRAYLGGLLRSLVRKITNR